jgi:nitric oxide reductase NorE protein
MLEPDRTAQLTSGPPPASPASSAGGPAARANRSNLPGDEGFWFFIAGDLCLFAVLFLVFMTARMDAVGQFELAHKTLHPGLGLVSTLVLITSSYFMARAVVAARACLRGQVVRNLSLAVGIGSLFAVVKAVDYGGKFAAGIGPTTNDFFMYYFALTGLHLLHYLAGLAVLTISLLRARRARLQSGYTRWIESVGVYWHMVDLLWIFLFAMFYLLRAP